MAKSASKSALQALHEMLAEVFLEDLRESRASGIPLPASNLNAIRQFLKDNDITASVEAEDMATLRDEFKDELAAKRAARQQAMESALQDDDIESLLR